MNTSRGSSHEIDRHDELKWVSDDKTIEKILHDGAYKVHTFTLRKKVHSKEDANLKLKSSSFTTAQYLDLQAGNITGKTLLYIAVVAGKRDMVIYRYENSEEMNGSSWTDETRGGFLLACVEAELFDIAQQIVKECPELAVNGRRILGVLARKPCAFRKKYNLIQKFIYQYDTYDEHVDEGNQAVQLLRTILAIIPKPKLDDMLRGPAYQNMEELFSPSVLFVAAEFGNTVFIAELISYHPCCVVLLNDKKQSIFHVAVSYRHFGIYNLLHDIGSMKDSIIKLEDESGNSLLHLVGIIKDTKLGNHSQYLQGPVVQLEQERQWFMMVSDMLPPSLRDTKNKSGVRPRELFTKNHKELLSKSIESLEKTSLDLVVVASVIATISFGIDIAFIGRYEQDTGKPMFPRKNSYRSMLWNVISLLLAYTSIFLAVYIVRSSYAESAFFSSSLHKLRSAVVVVGVSFMLQTLAFLYTLIRLFQDISLKTPYRILIPYFALFEDISPEIPCGMLITSILFVQFRRIYGCFK